MREVVASGRTVEEAIAAALERAGLTREEAEIHVLDEGSRGVFGLGAREARVRVVPRAQLPEEPPDARTLATATEIARTLVSKMGFSASVLAHATERGLFLDVQGEDLGLLIGRRGQGIEAVETVLSAMVHQATGSRAEVEVDIGGYRARRRQHVAELARRAARRAVAQGKAVHLPPMDARERRVAHTTLAGDPKVTTRSEGTGEARHVVVEPTGRAVPARPARRPPRRPQPQGRGA
ncbi:MAG: RNA-binding cell elongation regulator Jag/EloR [Armatimonadota bacterium]|nr:protein jag [Armatimonadota bacterium]MDW8155649.1 RNA-binding cell elongation regulator Jag/EloR [Armatimonadota bacterium]